MADELRDNLNSKKKIKETVREPNGAIFMLRCAQLGLHEADLAGMSVGMVYDLATEKANDEEEWPYKATQEDIDALFGGGE